MQIRIGRYFPFIVMFACIGIIILSCLQALHFPFVSDDNVYITTNAALADLPWTELWQLFVQSYNPWEFLPLRDLSYWMEMTWFGTDPSVFRTSNIILYAICCLFVYFTTHHFWRHFRPSQAENATWVAAITTALFAIHPSHIEAIVWVSGRKDVLSGMFAMLALFFAIKTMRGGFVTRYAIATIFALAAAILSKATNVTVAPVIALLWLAMWRETPLASRRYVPLLWPLLVLIVAASLALVFSTNSSVKYPSYYGSEAITRSLAILGWMVRLTVSPESRHFIYPVLDNWFIGMVTVGGLTLVAAGAGLVIFFKKRMLAGFLLVAFVLLCIPYMQLIPFSSDSLVYDRFLFLPVWAVAFLATLWLWKLQFVPRLAVLSIFFVLCAYQTIDRPKYWVSNETLFERDFLTFPENYTLAYDQIIERQLPSKQFTEARAAANNIADPEARAVMVKFVEVANAMVDAWNSGDPSDAVIQLNDLGILLGQPTPERAKWDPPLSAFWKKCNISYFYGWNSFMQAFPENELVQSNFRVVAMKYAGHSSQQNKTE